jgi:hypothetical protein
LGKQQRLPLKPRGHERLGLGIMLGALLKRWRFEEEETANLQLIESSPDLLLNFKLHPFLNLNICSSLYVEVGLIISGSVRFLH